MTGRVEDIEAARQGALLARARLITTMREIQERLTPGALMADVAREMRERGEELADDALAIVKARPVATAAIIAGIIAFLARGAILPALARLFFPSDATRSGDRQLQDVDTGANAAPHDEETVR